MSHVNGNNGCADDEINGGGVVSLLPENYQGRVAMSYRHGTVEYWATFTNVGEAHIAASMATRGDIGGYLDVQLHPGDKAPVGTNIFGMAVDWFVTNN